MVTSVTPCGIIAILTDFGLNDPYVAMMKAVALDICPYVKIVDIVHTVNSFDIEGATFVLYITYRYFPRGTVFVAIVDPGVGSSRKAIAIATKNYIFIGPDNGLLVPSARDDGIVSVYLIENDRYFRKPTSKSFHGRDIFMPIASHIVCGLPLDNIGRKIEPQSLVDLDLDVDYIEKSGNCVKLKAIYIDKFGNIVLSTSFSKLKQLLEVDIGTKISLITNDRKFVTEIAEVFSLAPKGSIILYENSFGFAELALNQGSAQNILNINRSETILLCKD
ncbi:MAG: SAM-dependent chlorinase/fluorinase [Ignisphaera sp.]